MASADDEAGGEDRDLPQLALNRGERTGIWAILYQRVEAAPLSALKEVYDLPILREDGQIPAESLSTTYRLGRLPPNTPPGAALMRCCR